MWITENKADADQFKKYRQVRLMIIDLQAQNEFDFTSVKYGPGYIIRVWLKGGIDSAIGWVGYTEPTYRGLHDLR